MSTQQTVCFVIHGPDLVRIARDRLLEDDPGHAWRIASCLNGDGANAAAIAILKGEKTLIGDSTSGMDLVDEADDVGNVHRERVAWLYAGRIRRNNKWWRPVAEIQDYGPNDLPPMNGRTRLEMRNEDPRRKRSDYPRAWHYADLDECVFPEAHDGKFDRAVIWEICGELPAWITPPLSPRDALAAWKASGRTLEERGHSYKYGVTRVRDVDGPVVDDAAAARKEREADEDARYAEEDRQRGEQLTRWREAILKQADGDTFVLSWEGNEYADAGSAVVPRAPFVRWCVNRYSKLRHLAPAWTNICPHGLKMTMDDIDHSDWMVGAGLSVRYDYHSHPSYNAAINEMSMIVAELGDRQRAGVVMLSPGPVVIGPIAHGKPGVVAPPGSVVILPDLRPQWLPAIEHARAVITEEGGAVAHLANVARERGLPILRWPGARTIWRREGDLVRVNAEEHEVTTADEVGAALEDLEDE